MLGGRRLLGHLKKHHLHATGRLYQHPRIAHSRDSSDKIKDPPPTPNSLTCVPRSALAGCNATARVTWSNGRRLKWRRWSECGWGPSGSDAVLERGKSQGQLRMHCWWGIGHNKVEKEKELTRDTQAGGSNKKGFAFISNLLWWADPAPQVPDWKRACWFWCQGGWLC